MSSNFVKVTVADVHYVVNDTPTVIIVDKPAPAVIEIAEAAVHHIVTENPSTILVETPVRQVIEVVSKGPAGPPGSVSDSELFLQKANHLSEFAADSQAQQEAQSNLGLGMVDPLAYYILAKA